MYACGMQVLGRRDQAFFRTPYIIVHVQAHGNILDTVSACTSPWKHPGYSQCMYKPMETSWIQSVHVQAHGNILDTVSACTSLWKHPGYSQCMYKPMETSWIQSVHVQAHGNILDTVSACMFDIPGVVYACLHDIKLNSSWCIYTYKWQ